MDFKIDNGARVTLRTVAQSLGLSVTTVSRALKEGPEVHSDTIAIVKEAASRLGYRPNLGGINLRTGKTHAIGIVLPFGREGEMNIVVASLIEGLSRGVKQANYRTIVVPQLVTDDPLTTVRNLVEEGSVDGIIITHITPQDDRVKYLLQVGMPFVTFGRTELLSVHPSIDIDHETIGSAAAGRLLDAGHESPLLITPAREYSYSLQFARGWRREFERRHFEVAHDRVFFAAATPDSGKQIALDALALHPGATAAFVASEEAALGFISGLKTLRRSIPDDFAMLTYGGTRLNDFFNPPLSTYYFSNFTIGQRLANLLQRSISGEKSDLLRELVQAEFVSHGSEI